MASSELFKDMLEQLQLRGLTVSHDHVAAVQKMQQIAHGLAKSTDPGVITMPIDINSATQRLHMIAIRFRKESVPLRKIATFVEGDTVHIFVVTPQGNVTFEDPASTFPSDTLMAQLSLLVS